MLRVVRVLSLTVLLLLLGRELVRGHEARVERRERRWLGVRKRLKVEPLSRTCRVVRLERLSRWEAWRRSWWGRSRRGREGGRRGRCPLAVVRGSVPCHPSSNVNVRERFRWSGSHG